MGTLDSLSPVLEPRCVAGRCGMIDLRSDPISACMSDADCVAFPRVCCEIWGSRSPSAYVAVRAGARLPACATLSATPCVQLLGVANTGMPVLGPAPPVFCASDGHCAVK